MGVSDSPFSVPSGIIGQLGRCYRSFGNENDIKTVKADLACSPDAAGKSEVVLSSAM